MICKLIHFLYGVFPNDRWKAFLIETHYSHCEKCREVLPSDAQIKFMLISPDEVDSGPRFWTDIEKAITRTPKIRAPIKTKSRASLFPKWQWIAGALVIIGLTIFIPLQIEKTSSTDIQEVSRAQIVLKSIKIEEAPAKTYFFQSKNPNRLIIWAQKSN